ncbi:MAG: S-layer family protein [Cyanobacteria bacterium J06638_38]
MTGVSQNEIPFVSYVSTGTTPGSTGKGADLSINTKYLLVAGGAQVDSPVFGGGDGGTLSVNAERVELIGGSRVAGSSGLFAPIVPGATGDGGDINLVADSLLVAGGAQAFTLTVSGSTAGDFNIAAQDIELNATSPNGTSSGLFSNTFANGDGGNVNIETDSLALIDGAEIGSTVSGTGTAGNIKIKANSIVLTNPAPLERPSSIAASVRQGATGVGGDITIETDSLSLNDGTQINSLVQGGSGDGGNVSIAASEINLNGYSAIADRPSGVFTVVNPGAIGNSGNVTITADNLTVSDGAQISVATGGFGSAGDLQVTALKSVELTGNAIAEGGGSSGLFSSAVFGDGNGGNIDLTTNQLIIKDGATVSASNFLSSNSAVPPGTGVAGNININAQTIALDGVDADTPASINAATFAGGGGNIALNSKTITATNGAQVTADTSGSGTGGLIQVKTNNLSLSNGAGFSSSTSAEGNAGAIAVSSDLVEISHQGTISTSSTGSGRAGNISLNVNTANFRDAGSGVFSEVKDTATGDGGSIVIATQEFNLNNQAQVSANSTGLGQAGNIAIASDTLNLDEGKITATSIQTGGGDIDLVTDSLFLDNNSLISTSVLDSTGGGGNILIDNSGFIIGENGSAIRADAVFGDGGNIQINAQGIFFDLDSEITASSKFGVDGIVEINLSESDEKLGTVYFPDKLSTPEAIIVSSCPVPESNSFTVTGSGGLPENPSSYLRGRTVWQDTRRLAREQTKEAEIQVEPTSFESGQEQETAKAKPIVESQNWIINQRGKVELVAANSQRISPNIWSQDINCGDL